MLQPRATRTEILKAAFALASIVLLFYPSHARAQAQGATPAAGGANGASVSLLFTALDKEKQFVTTLTAADLRVTEDGSARTVAGLRRQSDLPLFLAVALDTSASQERLLGTAKLAADVFVKGMMRPGVDSAAVLTFTGEATLEQAMTGDVARVRAAVARVRFVPPAGYIGGGMITGQNLPNKNDPAFRAGSTAIWDAVYVVSEEVLTRGLGAGRRALILITDGVDTSSRLKMDEAIKAALQSEAAVYAIGIGDEKNFDGVERDGLRKLAERTGGRAFFPKKVRELTDIFTQIQTELLSQYVLTFASPHARRDGSFHKVKIEIVNPELRKLGLQIAHPQGYFAGNAPTAVKK